MIRNFENIFFELKTGLFLFVATGVMLALIPEMQPVMIELKDLFFQSISELNTQLYHYLSSF